MVWCNMLTFFYNSKLQLFTHVLKIHNVKLDMGALAAAMGNGEFGFLCFGGCFSFAVCTVLFWAKIVSLIPATFPCRLYSQFLPFYTFSITFTIHTYPSH